MIVLTLVWCTTVALATPLNQEPLLMISKRLSSEHNTASWTPGSYVSKRNRFSIRFSNLSTILSPKFDRYELLIRVLDSTLDVPSVHYRNKNHLTELEIERDFDDGVLQRVPLSKNIVHGLSSGLNLRVSRINLNTHDNTTPMLVAYGRDSEQIDLEEFLGGDFDGRSRMKRDVETNMVDSDDVKDSPCHLRDLWMDFREEMHPPVVNIRQCVGSCSYDLVQRSKGTNNHTRMQAYLGVKKPGETHVPSCCVPVEFKSKFFRVSHEDPHRVDTKELQNLIVTKCGCR